MSTQQTFIGLGAAGKAETALNTGKRGCYRCADCLSVLFVDNAPGQLKDLVCGACGGRMDWQGYVGRQGLYNTYTDSACDFQCTSARGPSCDCKCGGENHGTKRTVLVVVGAGEVPTATPPDASKSALTAAEFRKERDAARARLEAKYATVNAERAAGFIPRDRFNLWLEGQNAARAFFKAKTGKTNARIKALRAICTSVQA